MDRLTGIGLYTFREASRFTRAQPREIRRWLRGYEFNYRGEQHASAPLWNPEIELSEAIGFRDLLELRLVKHFVSNGVHLTLVRTAIETARKEFGTDYPLTAHRFLTDGRRIFHEAFETASSQASPLRDLVAHQYVLDDVVRPSLYAGIEYRQGGKQAQRWYPMQRTKAVVLDPQIAFGKPVLADYGIPVDAIAAAVAVEKSEARVARIFEIPRSAVSIAVRYEQRLTT
jgi:uncharacterized protein (DUF433 family)